MVVSKHAPPLLLSRSRALSLLTVAVKVAAAALGAKVLLE